MAGKDIESMDCTQLNAFLGATLNKANKDAEALREDIEQCEKAKKEAETKMHKAAGKKDKDAYREAAIMRNMYEDHISQAMEKRGALLNESLLKPEVANAIREKMDKECASITGKAATEIEGILKKIVEIRDNALKEYGERNKVYMRLHECTRPKTSYGEPAAPKYYRDDVITPYVNVLLQLRGNEVANFRYVVDHFNKPRNAKQDANMVKTEKQGRPETGEIIADGEVIPSNQ